jgi:hypothetical protein
MCTTIDNIIDGLNSHFDNKVFKAGYMEDGNIYFRCNMTEILFDKNGAIVQAQSRPKNNPDQTVSTSFTG